MKKLHIIGWTFVAIVGVALAVAWFMARVVGIENPTNAKRVLMENGMTRIEIVDRSGLACGRHNFYTTGFKAVNLAGNEVEGTVCEGLFFKGSQIRYH